MVDIRRASAGDTKLAAYLIARTQVLDPVLMERYRQGAAPLAQRFGSSYLVRATGARTLEGSGEGDRVIVATFANMALLEQFWSSPEYTELKKLRQAGANTTVWVANDQ